MRCFTVTESRVTSSIEIEPTPYPHIAVGESGRGRELTRFPVGLRFANSLAYQKPCFRRGEQMYHEVCPECSMKCTSIPGSTYFRHPEEGKITYYSPVERASVLKTREKGTFLLIEEQDPADHRALVLVNIAAGFRGGTEWTGAVSDEAPCPYWGEEVWSKFCPRCKTLCFPIEGTEKYQHPEGGTIPQWTIFPPSGIITLAQGCKAQGAAGRMGGHVVRLLLMEPGTSFRVHRTGRLYGAPVERFVFWDGETLHLGTQDEVWPPSCEMPEGELI